MKHALAAALAILLLLGIFSVAAGATGDAQGPAAAVQSREAEAPEIERLTGFAGLVQTAYTLICSLGATLAPLGPLAWPLFIAKAIFDHIFIPMAGI